MAARVLLAVVALACPVGAAQGPEGKYCGIVGGLHLKMDFTDSSHFDVNMTVDQQNYPCKHEPYTFETSGSISTSVRDANDCLHDGFRKHMDDPDTVFFNYYAEGNRVMFIVDSVSSQLSPAQCDVEAAKGPQGKYCGIAGGLHLKMDFTDSSHFDVNMTVDQQNYPCKHEPYTLATSGSISTSVRDANDCLHDGFRKHFDDPDTVFFNYYAEGNRVMFILDSVSSQLSPAQCGLEAPPSAFIV